MSPSLTDGWMSVPSVVRPPGPTARTLPSLSLLIADSGRRTPPLLVFSAIAFSTKTRSSNGTIRLIAREAYISQAYLKTLVNLHRTRLRVHQYEDRRSSKRTISIKEGAAECECKKAWSKGGGRCRRIAAETMMLIKVRSTSGRDPGESKDSYWESWSLVRPDQENKFITEFYQI